MRILFVSILSFLMLNSANAQSGKANDTNLKWFINYRIVMCDANNDGEIAKEEMEGKNRDLWAFYRVPQNFKFTDKNESGTLSSSELKAMRYREEGNALQEQANTYDKALDTYGFKSLSSVKWLTENEAVATKVMSNYEWLANNKERFNEISKSNWLGIHDNIVTDIATNYFLILRRPDLAKTLSKRYPRQMNMFAKSFDKYTKSRAKTKSAKPTKTAKPTKQDVEQAGKNPKRTFGK